MARRQFQDAGAGRVAQSSAADDRDRRQDSGTFAWSVRSGHARLNLITGHAAFEVEALAINGAQFSGTPGPKTDGHGTFVCNATDATRNTPGLADRSFQDAGDLAFVKLKPCRQIRQLDVPQQISSPDSAFPSWQKPKLNKAV
jgi:hypothetical protein